MANRRQKKKQQKRKQIEYLQRQNVNTRNKTYYEINQLYQTEREKETKKPKKVRLSAEEKRQKKNARRGALRQEKLEYLVSKGFNPFDIKSSDLNKSWEYIHNLIPFDLNRVYKFKDNQRMYIAFRDFSGERDFLTILNEQKNLSNNALLDRLKDLVNTPPIHTGKGSGSSGSAGDYKLMIAEQDYISMFNNETRNSNRRKKKKKWSHSGENIGYQVLKSNGRNSFDSYTPRKLLEVMVAIMENVTETDRVAFYNTMYKQIKHHNQELANILPEPKF